MRSSENKNTVLRFNHEFLAQGNIEVLKEIIADDFVNHTAVGVPNTVEGLKQLVSLLHLRFSNFRVEIQEMIGEGDTVATRKSVHATHTGDIMGHPATGKTVAFNVMDFVRLRDGKYVGHWGRNDIMEVIAKL